MLIGTIETGADFCKGCYVASEGFGDLATLQMHFQASMKKHNNSVLRLGIAT